jgi:hypothetical protein
VQQLDDPVDMIGHDNVFVKNDMRIMIRQIAPGVVGDGAVFAQRHFTIDNLPEQTQTVVRTDRHVIETRRGIIPIGATGGFDAVAIAEEGHDGEGVGLFCDRDGVNADVGRVEANRTGCGGAGNRDP